MNEKSTSKIISRGQYTITDLFDGEPGSDSKSVQINGLTSFMYDNKEDTTPTPSTITLTANLQNIKEYSINWQYKISGSTTYTNIVSASGCVISSDKLTLTLNDKACFSNILTEFRIVVTDTSVTPSQNYIATHSIGKIYGGIDSYTCVLTNESDTILFNQDNIIKPNQIGSSTSKAFSSIIVKKGATTLLGVAETETPSVGQFKFKFEPTPVNCTAKRYGESSFYLDTITQNANNGKVSVTIYLEGNTNKITKEYTWSKVIDGVNAKYLILEGEDKFKYDSISDTTPTPSSITLTATAFNIPNATYKWQYNNGTLSNVTSGTGCLIENNKLTINDTKLFGNSNSVRIICSTTYNGVTYSDSKSIIKVYDGEQGPIGPTGKPSKSVIISGGNLIHYDKTNVANPSSIKLTATSQNYTTPNYKWYYNTSSGYQLISGQTTNTLTVPHNSNYFLNDIAMFKVECSETNGTDKLSYEHTITKTYDGTDASSLVLNIIDGTRNICYNGKGVLVSTIINPFKIELYEDNVNVTSTSGVKSITWSAKGHYSHKTVGVGSTTFKPTALSNYDEALLDTSVSVIVNYNGRIIKQSAPVTVSKNSTALDWVEEWDNSKVDIGGNYIIAPKIFAGKKNGQTNTITGVALGQDIVNKNSNIGMAIYNNNQLIGKINADPSLDGNKMLVFGNTQNAQLILYSDGRLEIGGELKVTSSSTNTTINNIINTTNKTEQALNNMQIGGTNILENSKFDSDFNNWSRHEDISIVEKGSMFCAKIPHTGLQSTKVVSQSILSDLIAGETYTMSGWVKTENVVKGTTNFACMFYIDGSYLKDGVSTWYGLGSKQFKLNSGWEYVTYTFTAKSEYIPTATSCNAYVYTRDMTGDVYFHSLKIEKGNKPTDWSPSPKDITNNISNMGDLFNQNLDSAMSATEQNILDSIKDKYAVKGEIVRLEEAITSTFEQTSEAINMKFDKATEYTELIDDELQKYKEEVSTNIRFSDSGIELGKSNSPFKAKLDNTKLAFTENDTEIAYISNNKMYITNAEIKDTLRIGESGQGFFTWTQSASGNLGLKWSEN